MGTNFYTLDGIHLGKRYASGKYCYECKTQCLLILTWAPLAQPFKPTSEETHRLLHSVGLTFTETYETNGERFRALYKNPPQKLIMPTTLGWCCPICGAQRLYCDDQKSVFEEGPAARELGFDRRSYLEMSRPTGIDGASGWIWRLNSPGRSDALGDTAEAVKTALKRRRTVKDEYGHRVTMEEFGKMFDHIIPEQESDYEFT